MPVMGAAMWVLIFAVDGWESQGIGFNVKAFWSQASCETVKQAHFHEHWLFSGEKRYKGYYKCVYEAEWNAKKWNDAVEREK